MANLYPLNTSYGSEKPKSFELPSLSSLNSVKSPKTETPASVLPPQLTQPSSVTTDLVQRRLGIARENAAQTQLRKSLSQNLTSSYKPFNQSQFSQLNSTFGATSPTAPGDTLTEAPFRGESMSLSEYQTQNPNSILNFDPQNDYAGWGAPSDQAVIKKGTNGGFYVEDPNNPDLIAHQPRGDWDRSGDTALLNGLSPRLFQIDHIIPLFAGGVNENWNKQILPIDLHVKKTKVQAVPLTIWRTFNNNPGLAKEYGMTPMDLATMRESLMAWKDYSDVGIPSPDDNGLVPIDTAVKAWKAWQTGESLQKKGILDYTNLAGRGIRDTAAELFSSIPVIGPMAMSGLRGIPGIGLGAISKVPLVGPAASSYIKKYVAPDFFERADLEEARERREAITSGHGQWTGQGKYALENYPIMQKIQGGLDWLDRKWVQTSPANETVQDISDLAVGGIQMGVEFKSLGLGLGKIGEVLGKGKIGVAAAKTPGTIIKTTAKVENAVGSSVSKILGLPAKAWKKFGTSKKATEAVANTVKAAEETVALNKGLNMGKQVVSPILKQTYKGKAPIIAEEYLNAMKIVKSEAVLKNIGLMNVHALIQQQDDRSMKATAERALWATIYGKVLGFDGHNLPGYLKVFGKGLTLGIMEGGANYDENSEENVVMGALQNAIMLTALHGTGHSKQGIAQQKQTKVLNRFAKAAEKTKPGEKIDFKLTPKERESGVIKDPNASRWMKSIKSSVDVRDAMQQNLDKMIDYKSAEILASALPKSFNEPGEIGSFKPETYFKDKAFTPEEIALIKKEGIAKIEEAWSKSYSKNEKGEIVKINGEPVSSGTVENVQADIRRFVVAVDHLGTRALPPEARAQKEIADLKSYGGILRDEIGRGEAMVEVNARKQSQEMKDYVTTQPPEKHAFQSTSEVVRPEEPVGVGISGGRILGRKTTATANSDRILAAYAPGAQEKPTYRAYLEVVPYSASAEKARRSQMTALELASRDAQDAGVIPEYRVKVNVILKGKDGKLIYIPAGELTQTEAGLNKGNFAVNDPWKWNQNMQARSKDFKFEVVNLTADHIGKWAKENNVPGVIADISTNNGIGKRDNFYVKVVTTPKNLETTKRIFEGTGQAVDQAKSRYELLDQTLAATNPVEVKQSVQAIKDRMIVEPFDKLIDMVYEPKIYGEKTTAVKELSKTVNKALETGDPIALAKAINEKFGEVVTPEMAKNWINQSGELNIKNVMDVLQEAGNSGRLNETGLKAYKDVMSFFKSDAYQFSPIKGAFTHMPLKGSKPVAPAEAGIMEAPLAEAAIKTEPVLESKEVVETPLVTPEAVKTTAEVSQITPEATKPMVEAKQVTENIEPVVKPVSETLVEPAKIPAAEKKPVAENAAAEFLNQEKVSTVKPKPSIEAAKKEGSAIEPVTTVDATIADVPRSVKEEGGMNVSIRQPAEARETALREEHKGLDGVDANTMERPDSYGQWKNKRYGQTTEIFNQMKESFEPNSKEYKILEKADAQLSTENLISRFREKVAKNNGDTQKAIKEQTEMLESYAKKIGEMVGKETETLFPTQKSKEEFARLLIKNKDPKARVTIELVDNKVVPEKNKKAAKMEPRGPIDEMVDSYNSKHPDRQPLEVFRFHLDTATKNKVKNVKDLLKIVNEGKPQNERIVQAGMGGNSIDTLVGIKYNDALARSYKPGKGEGSLSLRDRFLRAMEDQVYQLGNKDKRDLGRFNKRTSLINFHEPPVDWRGADGKQVSLDIALIKPESLKELGLLNKERLDLKKADGSIRENADKIIEGIGNAEQGDGTWYMTEKGFTEYKKAHHLPPELGYGKTAYVKVVPGADGKNRLLTIKGQIHILPESNRRLLERKMGNKIPDTMIIMPEGDVKMGLESFRPVGNDIQRLRVPSDGLRGKVHGEHNSNDATFSPSGLGHLQAKDGVTPEVTKIYKEPGQRYVEAIKELNASIANREGREKRREIFEKYSKDLKMSLESTDYEAMKILVKEGDSFSLEHVMDKALASALPKSVLSGKNSVKGTHNFVAPDYNLKGGRPLESITSKDVGEFGRITNVADVIRKSTGKSGMPSTEKIVKNWEEMFGEGTLSARDAKTLANGGKEADINLVFEILKDAKKAKTLSEEGQAFLESEYKRTMVQTDEFVLTKKDWIGLGRPEHVFVTRQPITSDTAPSKHKVIIAENYGANLGDGVSVGNMHDLVVRKQGDHDGDSYSIFAVGEKPGMLSPKIADSFEAKREKRGDVVLDPLNPYEKIDTTSEGMERVIDASMAGGEGVASSRSMSRILNAVNDSNLEFNLSGGRKIKLNLDKDARRLFAQVSQEATDSVKNDNFDKRMRTKDGIWDAGEYLINEAFKLNSKPGSRDIREIKSQIKDFHIPFQLANQTKSFSGTNEIADKIQQVSKLNVKIRAAGGEVHPLYQAVEESLGNMEAFKRRTVDEHQKSDLAGSEAVKKYAEDKYGAEEFKIKPGTPEDKIRKAVSDIQKTRAQRKRSGFRIAEEAFAKDVLEAVENKTLNSERFELFDETFYDDAIKFAESTKAAKTSKDPNAWWPNKKFSYSFPEASVSKVPFVKKYFDKLAFNNETDAIRAEGNQAAINLYKMFLTSKQGLSPEQIRRINYFLLTDPKADSNFYESKKSGRGKEDVRRITSLFTDKELRNIYFQAREKWDPTMPSLAKIEATEVPPNPNTGPQIFKTLGK